MSLVQDQALDGCQPISGAVGAGVPTVDVTGRTSADIAAQRLASIVESSDDAIISKDLNGIIQSWNRGAERIFGYTADEAVGKPVTILIPADFLDEEPTILGRIIKGERIDHYETMRQRKDGMLIHVSLTVSPIRNAAGTIVGASKVGRDITESKTMQKKQRLLLQEMNHRIKNLFAVASGVVSVSARGAATPKEMAASVQSRLAALARAHDLTLASDLENTQLRKAQLSDLVRTILAPYDTGEGHLAISGPQLECGSGASTSFALLLHEFATNSVKYGALSRASGRVTVTWTIADTLNLLWTEEAGATLAPPPEKQGFGGILVEATVAGLGGTIQRDWRPEGLQITLTAPLPRIVA